jgi:hypothetical protein
MGYKKNRDTQKNQRFNSQDLARWQKHANSTTGGNLTMFMEESCNEKSESIEKVHPMPKSWKPKQ